MIEPGRENAIELFEESGILWPSAEGIDTGRSPAGTHLLSDHDPVWAYVKPSLANPFPDQAGNKELFAFIPKGAPPASVLDKTRLVIFIGAGRSSLFRFFSERGDVAVMVFEPDPAVMREFASGLDPALAENGLTLFSGLRRSLPLPLGQILPRFTFELGFPVFFIDPELERVSPNYSADIIRYVEILYYRSKLYPLEGQANQRGRPLRNIKRGQLYDQLRHAYQNIRDFASRPGLDRLRGRFEGECAILAAAGPDLAERMDYIRKNKDRAVVIAVNTALKPLLAAGLAPHFTVINDTAVQTEKSLSDLPSLEKTILVGHCQAFLGRNSFKRKFIFGDWGPPHVFGKREGLRLHGSVISTAFSLARFMGCATCVFLGAQLASDNPWSMSYAKGAVNSDQNGDGGPRPLTNRFPQLYPTRNYLGEDLFTSLNFLDAALWLMDEIRYSGLRCVNPCKRSLLHGPGVEYDPDFAIPDSPGLESRFREVLEIEADPLDPARVRRFVINEIGFWKKIKKSCEPLLELGDRELIKAGAPVLGSFEGNNVSYMVQRFRDFDNFRFHRLVFDSGSEPETARGLRYYFEHVRDMADELADLARENLS